MAKSYRLWLEIQEADESQDTPERYLLATVETREEALAFKTQLEHCYSPEATGERKVADQMSTPDQFTPG